MAFPWELHAVAWPSVVGKTNHMEIEQSNGKEKENGNKIHVASHGNK